MMKRRTLLTSLAAGVLALSAAVAQAGPPDEASGDWTYIPVEIEIVKTAGPNTFVEGVTSDRITGTFNGMGTQEFTLVNHKGVFNIYHGVTVFDPVTVADESGIERTGTLTIRTTGKQQPGTVEPGPGLWNGTWVIIDGTGELEHLQGRGTLTGPSLDLDYDGQFHFSEAPD